MRTKLHLLMADMFFDGALTGMEEAKAMIIRMSKSIGSGKAAEFEKERDGGALVISPADTRAIMKTGIREGGLWAGDIEEKVKRVYRKARARREDGKEVDDAEVRGQVHQAILDNIETSTVPAAFAQAKRMKATNKGGLEATEKVTWRKKHTARRWSKQAKKAKAAPGKTRKKLDPHSMTRLRTGWNKWHNNRVGKRVQANPEVIYLYFALGNAANHTDTCLARSGMVMKKDDPRWASNTPPLHWNCRSRLIPVTKSAAKEWGVRIKFPAKAKTAKAAPQTGFSLTRN